MPAPVSVDEFLAIIRKGDVLEESRLETYMAQLRETGSVPPEPQKLAGMMVRDGILTHFQADQFLNGKWKRFNIGKYRVLERIGSGGMGQVFLCEHRLMRRRVALKVLPTAKADDPSSLERFYREARAVAALDHPNIVRAYDIDQDDNLHFLVMEYVEGASFQDLVRRVGPLDPTRVAHYMYWASVGLQSAHEAGLIHRDIKPGNILVDRQGIVKILDLGLARFFNDDDDAITRKYDENVLGTADYLAPEQAIDSHTVDGRADIYSLGATMYFCLTAHSPFVDGTVAQKLIWHQVKDPKPISAYRADVPEELAAIVRKMMAKNRDDRFQSPIEVAEALTPWLSLPINVPTEAEMPRLSLAAQTPGTGAGTASTMVGGRSMVGPTTRRQPGSVLLPPIPLGASFPPGSSRKKNPPASVSPGSNMGADPSSDETRRRAANPTVEPLPGEGEQSDWGGLAADTRDSVRDDTGRRSSAVRQGRTPSPKPQSFDLELDSPSAGAARAPARTRPTEGRSRLPLYIGGGIFGSLLFLAAIYFAFKKPSTTPSKSEIAGPRTYTISRQTSAEDPATFASILDLINARKLKSGDTIALAEAHTETLSIGAGNVPPGVTITSATSVAQVWKPSGQIGYILGFGPNLEGLTIRNIIFDANGQAEGCIKVARSCPGLLLENVQMRNTRLGGQSAELNLAGASGTAEKPIAIRGCRLIAAAGTDIPAIELRRAEGNSAGQGALYCQHIRIEGNRFEGAFRSALSVGVPCQDIEFVHNRVWKTVHGIQISLVNPPDDTFGLSVNSNTFHSLSESVIRLGDAGPWFDPKRTPRIAPKIDLKLNWFQGVKTVAFADGATQRNDWSFLRPEDNARDAAVPADNMPPVPVTVVAGVVLPVDPLRDGEFLRYDRNSPLFRGGNKPLGVPPIGSK